jgi:hypothetical protein
VLRSVGGAAGSTVAGAIIASGLIVVQRMDGVAGSGLPAASAHLDWSFAMVYGMAALFAAISFVVTLRMPNTPLRESLHAVAVSE